MEIRNSSQISIAGSLLIHLLMVWIVAQQVAFPDLPDPKPKVQVRVVKKEPPPPPPEVSKTKPMKPVESVQKQLAPVPREVTKPENVQPAEVVKQKPVTPPRKMTPQKPVQTRTRQVQAETIKRVSMTHVPKTQAVPQKPVQQTVQAVPPATQPKVVQQKVVPKTVQPVTQVTNPAPTPVTQTAQVMHTAAPSTFKTQVVPIPAVKGSENVMPQQSASLQAPVTAPGLKTDKAIQPKFSTVSGPVTGQSGAPMMTASVGPATNKSLKPVDKVEMETGPSGPDVQKALDQFNNAIWAKILNAKFYPRMAQLRRLEGQPIVKFTIEKDGSLSNVTINNSSSHEILDKAALKTIQNAAPFPQIPEILKEERMVLEVPISFILK